MMVGGSGRQDVEKVAVNLLHHMCCTTKLTFYGMFAYGQVIYLKGQKEEGYQGEKPDTILRSGQNRIIGGHYCLVFLFYQVPQLHF